MSKVQYTANSAIMLETWTPPGGQAVPLVRALAAGDVSTEVVPRMFHVIAGGRPTGTQAKWKVLLVPHHGGAGLQTTSASKYEKWCAKLHSLTRLKDGWDSYRAPAPNQHAITNAELYLSTANMLGWEPSRVEASVMGGVGITHRSGKRKVYVEFYNDGRVHSLFSDGTPNMQTAPVGPDMQSYYRFIRKAREYLTNG